VAEVYLTAAGAVYVYEYRLVFTFADVLTFIATVAESEESGERTYQDSDRYEQYDASYAKKLTESLVFIKSMNSYP
jgi:hypothetical protein